MEKLFDILRIVEDIRLAPEVLEPDPVDVGNRDGAGGGGGTSSSKANGPASGDINDGNWTGEATRKGYYCFFL